MVLPDVGEGCHEQVHGAVDEGHIDSHDQYDGLEEEDSKWALDSAVNAVVEWGGVVNCWTMGLAGFLLEGSSFARKEDWGVGFAEEDDAEGRVDRGEYQH